ncbi:MAG: sulfatase-like hydrolase/transferase, partial [Campylobacterota bacterium]|nr:sulfatase-like hydrolase/transferase [Campylobacterota bacterium]
MRSLKELILWFVLILAILSLGRVVLFFTYFERVVNSGVDWWWMFSYGLRMDSIVASILSIIPALIMFTFPRFLKAIGSIFLRYYYLVVLLLVIYIENATFPFIAEFDVRPNEIFINYLEYPKEVFGNIWASYKLELFISFAMMALAGYLFLQKSRGRFEAIFEDKYWQKIALLIPVAAVLFLGVRSSIGWRPANISDAVFTSNHLVNEITKTSLYSIGYAYYSQKKHSSNVKGLYGQNDLNSSIEIVKNYLDINSTNELIPFLRVEKSHFKSEKPKNLVIFLQESLGAQFVGVLGDKRGLTPEFDKLSKEGILFTDLYSNGTRSVRGIAGVVAGFLPVAGQGVVKRNRSQSDFFTVASLLKPYGYYSSFIYGGEKRFDNMA